ncbi:MAG: ABC transporter substrate-binding protein, partial [Methylocella sp.]
MSKMFKSLIALSLALTASVAFAAEQVRVAVSSTAIFYPAVYVAKEMRYFDEAGLDVSIVDAGSGSNVISSVVGGSAEIGGGSIKNVSQAVAKGQPLMAFASALRGFPNFLVVRKGFMAEHGLKADSPFAARIASLKGSTIAVNDIGGSAGDFVRELLRRGGLGDRDAVLINVSSTPGRLAALKAKRVDGLVGYAPEPETAILEGYGEIIVDSSADIPETRSVEYITYYCRASYLKENSKTVEAFIRAVAKATALIKNDSAAARTAFFKQMATKSFGAKSDPRIEELQWSDMRPYFPADVPINLAEMAK